jgi:hypothetical protein
MENQAEVLRAWTQQVVEEVRKLRCENEDLRQRLSLSQERETSLSSSLLSLSSSPSSLPSDAVDPLRQSEEVQRLREEKERVEKELRESQNREKALSRKVEELNELNTSLRNVIVARLNS